MLLDFGSYQLYQTDESAFSSTTNHELRNKNYLPPETFQSGVFAVYGNAKINAKLIKKYAPKAETIFSPFSGHGTEPIIFNALGLTYFGQDTNRAGVKNINDNYISIIAEDHAQNNYRHKPPTVICRDSKLEPLPELIEWADTAYFSPPYFDFEVYDDFAEQIKHISTYDEFFEQFALPIFKNLFKIIKKGGTVFCMTEMNEELADGWKRTLERAGFEFIAREFSSESGEHDQATRHLQIVNIVKKP